MFVSNLARLTLSGCCLALGLVAAAQAQQLDPGEVFRRLRAELEAEGVQRDDPDFVRQISARLDAELLAAPFNGVTSDGKVQPGLYPVHSTGVSTEPVRLAAAEFLDALTPEQRSRLQFTVDDPEWRKWHNVPNYQRQGVSLREMTQAQKDSALTLLEASLSAEGLELTRNIMRLHHTMAEIREDFETDGEWRYWMTVMGEPSATKPWGWQIDGHHLVINYFVLGDQVVMTPTMMGANPGVAVSGKYRGVSIMRTEIAQALDIMDSLDEGQRATALLHADKTGNFSAGLAYMDNLMLEYAGVAGRDLSASQRDSLLQLAGSFVNNMDESHAALKLDQVRSYLDDTYFAWIGGTTAESKFYYRIHSPVILIEFEQVGNRPNVEHIHTVVRTPNGNDYGKDLLRQHHQTTPH